MYMPIMASIVAYIFTVACSIIRGGDRGQLPPPVFQEGGLALPPPQKGAMTTE